MKAKEVYDLLGIGRSRLSALVTNGTIGAMKVGRVYEYDDRDVLNYKSTGTNKRIERDTNKLVDKIVNAQDDNEIEEARQALRDNILSGDASSTKFMLQQKDPKYQTLDKRMENMVILHKAEY